MQNKKWMYLALVVLAILAVASVGGYIELTPKAEQIIDPNGQPQVNPTQTPVGENPTGSDRINKAVKIVFTDALGGTGFPQTTASGVKIYDSSGKVLQEPALTVSGSAVTTANSYETGTTLQVRHWYDTSIDQYMWWNIVVPSMSAADAESNTVNTIRLSGTGLSTLTDMFQASNGTVIADGEAMSTASALSTGTVTYSWNVGTDNTGFIEFSDPTYNPDLNSQIMVVAELSGTGYDKVTLQGFDGIINSGATRYYYKVLPTLGPNNLELPNELVPSVSKVKQGNDYVVSGTGAVTFSYSAISYTGSAASVQLTVYGYADVNYFKDYQTAGPYAATMAEQTIVLNQGT